MPLLHDGRVERILELEQVVQRLLRVGLLHDDFSEPRRQTILGAHDLRAGLDIGLRPNDALLPLERLQEIQALQRTTPRGVDVAICDSAAWRLSARDVGSARDAHSTEKRLLDQVDPPNPQVRLMHLPTTHAGIHLNQLRAVRCQLELYVEDAILEAEALQGSDSQILEDLLCGRGQARGADSPSLVEVRLQSRTIVGHRGVAPVAVAHDHIDVDLASVQVLLHEDGAVHDLVCINTCSAAVVLHQRTTGNHQAVQLRDNLPVA
mmetsp:Transcript_65252/g.187699  ORF Transcript_65252/g.187699 Transcript_65252/m.187699 type:complete len:264 (+) Transcript_65252:457-1248(+)